MTRSEALKAAQKKYAQKVRHVMVKFNMEREDEKKLFAHLERQGRMQTYIKDLIRQDMESGEEE